MAEVRELASGLEFPEGPVVLPDGSVAVCEIKGGRITRVAPDGTKDVIAELASILGDLAPPPDEARDFGRQVTQAADRLCHRETASYSPTGRRARSLEFGDSTDSIWRLPA